MTKYLLALTTVFAFTLTKSFSQKTPTVFGHQNCATARVVCNITDTASEVSLCNSSCSGDNTQANNSNSCFSNGLTRWGFYMFTIQQTGKLFFTINPNTPSAFEIGDYNFALFDVSNGCGNIGNAIRCSMGYNSINPAQNTGLDSTSTDTTEGVSGDSWLKYINAQCGHTYLLCLDVPNNDADGFVLSFGGTCTFGTPTGFTASDDTVCVGQPLTFSLNCNVVNVFITYQWNFGVNAIPSTYTGQNPPQVIFTTTGNHNITLTSTFTAGASCVDSSSQNIFVDCFGAVNTVKDENRISVFPNPFSTQTTLQSDNPFHNATLTVYNSQGQQVKQFVIRNSSSFVISRDNLASGLYFVRLTENNKLLAVDKLVITD